MLKELLLKRYEEIKPRPGEAAALVDRMKNGSCSEADRQRVLELLDAEQEMLELLVTCRLPSPSRKKGRPGQAKRSHQLAKASRRHNRR
jgi:hypothetical protein